MLVMVCSPIGLVQSQVFKFSVSFAIEVEKNRPSHGQCFNKGPRSTKDLKRASGHLSLSTNNVRDLKSLLLSWNCILVHSVAVMVCVWLQPFLFFIFLL